MPEHTSQTEAPTLKLLHLAALLTGLGTFILGPILPLLAARYHLDDAHTGLLLLAQFCGSFLGGVSTSHRLRAGTLEGLLAAAAGLLLFAQAPNLPVACAGLAVGGFGIGRSITTMNILAARRASTRKGAALARLNFTWSLGALLSPILAATLTPRVPLPTLLTLFAAAFAVTATILLVQSRNATRELRPPAESTQPFPTPIFLFFAAMLFLYGGFETCLSAWLTTFTLRYTTHSLFTGESTLVLLLIGLTAGRAASSWLLLRMPDRTLIRTALAVSATLIVIVSQSHNAASLAALAIALGFTLAPIFPATFALLLAQQPPARRAGIALAASGLGAAALPSLMGLVSTHAHSLQLALIIPVATALLMLALTFAEPVFPRPHPV